MPWFLTPHGPHFVVEPGTIDEYERRDYTAMTQQQVTDYFAGVAFPDPPSFATEAEVPGIVASAVSAGTGPVADALRAASVALIEERAAPRSWLVDPILSTMLVPAVGAGVLRETANLYRLMRHFGEQRWWRVALQSFAGPGGTSCHSLRGSSVDEPMVGVNQDNAAVVLTGTWTTRADARTYGGNYADTTTVGDKATLTTPAAVTRVGVLFNRKATGGIARVKIDGSATRADLLPTAQSLVDAGTLANTVLVAGGGPLAPTDRVIDMYNVGSLYDTIAPGKLRVVLADDLDPGVHTVEVELAGAKRAAASDDMISISGFTYATADTTAATANVVWCSAKIILDEAVVSAYEYATAIGAPNNFSGNIHGYDAQQSLTFTVDGQAVALADGQTALGRTVQVVRDSDLTHPAVNAGATKIMDVQVTYTVTDLGLRVQHRRTAAATPTILVDYPAMMPVELENRRGAIDTLGPDQYLIADDGTYKGQVEGSVAVLYKPDGRYAAALYLPDPETTTAGWDNAQPTFLALEDRNSVKKVYVTRVGSQSAGVTLAVGEVWESEFWLMVQRYPDGARKALQRY